MPIPMPRPRSRLHPNGWTPERRAKQSAAIRSWRPWARSTGPRTATGKAAIRNNARTHGLLSSAGRELMEALKLQKKFIQAVNLALKWNRQRQKQKKLANKLLEGKKTKSDEAVAASGPSLAASTNGPDGKNPSSMPEKFETSRHLRYVRGIRGWHAGKS